MASSSSSTTPFPTIVHRFESPTPHNTAFETGPANARNALVFIGGLGDGPFTVYYPRAISAALFSEDAAGADHHLSYSLFEVRLGSSYSQFGFKRLADDVADIAALVRYLRGALGRQKVVLMGHSTGTQDCIEYASPAYPDHPPVDGYVLQAPASDRGALLMGMGPERLERSVQTARDMIAAGKGQDRMPTEHVPAVFDVPISADRWYSLSAKDGGDNYFDPEYTDEEARGFWQRFDKPLLILHSGEDEYIPSTLDKEGLIRKWKTLCRPGVASDLSGVIPGANHRVEQPESEKWLVDTVIEFLKQSV